MASQALNGPFGPVQCLQLGERKHFNGCLGPPGPSEALSRAMNLAIVNRAHSEVQNL